MNGPWMDEFHKEFPKIPIGMSEYGCEALNWHTSDPKQGDYTEEYQAHYHEELIKQLYTRPYIWATHVWNMFDFAADARNEGGENGMNHKGLVTFDRKYKKDAFYDEVLKALWGYISDKLSIPVSRLSKDNIEGELRKYGVDEVLIKDFLDALNNCEFARFAPGDDNQAMDKVYSDSLEVISKMENSIKH